MRPKANAGFVTKCCCFIAAASIMPFVSRIISMYLTTYFYMVVLVLTALLILFSDSQSFGRYVSWLFPFIVWKLCTLTTNSDSIVMWGYRVLRDFIPLLAGLYLFDEPPERLSLLSKCIILALAVTSVTTILGVSAYPDAPRWMATAESSQDPMLIAYNLRNIGGYEFIYTLVLMYPLLIYAYKIKRINAVFTYALTALTAVAVFSTGYATAFVLFVLSSLLFFAGKRMSVKKMITLLIGAAIAYFLFSSLVSRLLLRLSLMTNNLDFRERLFSLSGGLSGVENSESNRTELWQMSINTFLRHPLFGTFLSGGRGTGGHSFILDFLGIYGSFGAVLLVSMYKRIFRAFYRPFITYDGYGYAVWIFFQALLLSTVNTGMWLYVLAFYAPVMLKWITRGVNRYESVMEP